jgi:hypothetical protein
VQAYGLAITIAFLGVLLAAGALAAERDENTIGRLVRGLISLGRLVVAKISLAVVVALGVGLAILLGFGIAVEAGNVTGGEPWQRLPLVLVGIVSPARPSARSARSSARSRGSRGRPRSSGSSSCCRSSSSGSSRARSSRRRLDQRRLPVRRMPCASSRRAVRRFAVGHGRSGGRWLVGLAPRTARSRGRGATARVRHYALA